MMSVSVYVIAGLVSIAGYLPQIQGSGWSYDDEPHWAALCHEGRYQSPVALSSSKSVSLRYMPPFVLTGYAAKLSTVMKNNGHSAEVRALEGQPKPLLHQGGLSRTYILDHLHFHWQSEHVMEDVRFPLELHLVHYGADYDNLTNAANYPDGIAVFGVLFHLSPDDDEEFKPLKHIIETLKDRVNDPVQLPEFSPRSFLPRDLAGYFRYNGSLTTPGCNEAVIWTVFTETIPISLEQVKVFEELHTESNTVLKTNYRSLQPLNGRTVYHRISPIPSPRLGGNAHLNRISWLFIAIMSCLVFCLAKN